VHVLGTARICPEVAMRIRLLGGLEVVGLRATEVGSRKARTLVSVLALARGATVPAAGVVDALWGDAPPARPLEQVGVLVSRLRSVLGADRVQRTPTGWSLRMDWLDLDELDERVAEAGARLAAGSPAAARAAAQAALALVRGELLADEPDAPWAEAERAAATRQVARARLVAAQAALATGYPGEAAASAEAALQHDPYDEVALRVLLRAHAAAGRPASALAAYARTRRRLLEDLGTEPTESTQQLHTEILLARADPRDDVPAAGGRRPIVGRAAELAALDARLARVAAGGTAYVVVEGEAGIGKTALLARFTAGVAGRAEVLAGRCDELGRGMALQPVLDALEAHLLRADPPVARAVLGDDAPLVGPLLGTGSAPLAAGAAAASPRVQPDPAAERAQLYAALLRMVSRTAGSGGAGSGGARPVVLVVDDLHLADAGTLAWLRFAVRRGRRLLVVVARRTGERAARAAGEQPEETEMLALRPLELPAVAELVGPERAPRLHARSGGNPLFLVALADADDGALPDTVRAAVSSRAAALGPAATTLRMAAVLGREVDVDLLAAVLEVPVRELLTHLEEGVAAGLVDDRGTVLAFSHDLVREALAATSTAAHRAFAHREAARVLTGRPGADPLTVAWHARRGGEPARAAAALAAAARRAVARHDLRSARAHLDEAVALADGPAVRMERSRLRLLRRDLAGAERDAAQALALGAGPEGLELAGWVAYYRRDHPAAARFAEAGREQAGRDEAGEVVRASCALLMGRLHHTRGDLGRADDLLVEAAHAGPPAVRGMARVWLASLRGHQGRADEAAELAERALLAPEPAHPFAAFHALFARAYALGLRGDPVGSFRAVDRLDALIAAQGEQANRFVGIAANMRAWVLRGVGRVAQAREHTSIAVGLTPGVMLDEPRGAGLLDLAETDLGCGDLPGAAAAVQRAAWVDTWEGSMFWRQRHRRALLRARLDLAGGDPEAAAARASSVAADAAARGAPRYAALARLLAARAVASGGDPVDLAEVDGVLAGLDRLAGLEAWWVTAEVAADLGVERWWRVADRRAAALVARAGPDAEPLRREVGARFARLGRR
jgi:DNA-binding SARP family transcriptional activator